MDRLQLLVFDSRRGNAEGQEDDKVLAGFPSGLPLVQQSGLAGLLQGLLLFTANFTAPQVGGSLLWHWFCCVSSPAHHMDLLCRCVSTWQEGLLRSSRPSVLHRPTAPPATAAAAPSLGCGGDRQRHLGAA